MRKTTSPQGPDCLSEHLDKGHLQLCTAVVQPSFTGWMSSCYQTVSAIRLKNLQRKKKNKNVVKHKKIVSELHTETS